MINLRTIISKKGSIRIVCPALAHFLYDELSISTASLKQYKQPVLWANARCSKNKHLMNDLELPAIQIKRASNCALAKKICIQQLHDPNFLYFLRSFILGASDFEKSRVNKMRSIFSNAPRGHMSSQQRRYLRIRQSAARRCHSDTPNMILHAIKGRILNGHSRAAAVPKQ